MSKTILFIPEQDRLLLKYQPSDIRDPRLVGHKLETEGRVTLRKTFSFERSDLVEKIESEEVGEFEYTFLFGVADGAYFRLKHQILGLKHDLLLTKECPEHIPEAKCFEMPVSNWSLDFSVRADSIDTVPVTWRLPDEQGCYWLTARTTGVAGRPVLSQRFVRAIDPPTLPAAVKRRVFVFLGSDHAAEAFFQSHRLVTSSSLDALVPDRHVVVVWDASRLSVEEKRKTKTLTAFLRKGGKMVVLSARSWDWPELCDVKVSHDPRFSRVFPYEDLETPLLDGIDPQWLIRWNGFPGTVAFGALDGPAMARAKKILWAREPKTTVMAAVAAASGGGRIVFSQLDLQGRVDRSKPNYNAVAERALLNLLGRGRF